MSRIYQIPGHARLWLTLSVVAACLPQLLDGPLWQGGLLVLVLLWREGVQRQRWPVPGRTVRLLLMLAVVMATWQSFGRLYGPQAGTALVTALFALKYLELVSKRDAHVLIVLGFFVCATVLLFHRGPVAALYVVGCLLLLVASLAGINHGDTRARGRQHLTMAATLVAQALPLTVVLFLLVPRIAPLWDLDLGGGQARTGMSDSLSPGQVSRLAQSAALAFRVQFDGPVPAHSELYWRGLTYTYFDGATWRQAAPGHRPSPSATYFGFGPRPDWYRVLQQARLRRQGPAYRYQVIAEPSHRRWLYALAVPFVVPGQQGIGVARDLRLLARHTVDSALAYRVVSVPGVRRGVRLSAWQRRRMLQLPPDTDPRAHRLARQWQARYESDASVVQAALRYFREQPFYYTLRPPPLLSGNTVDAFLFGTRRGFCEHYASSFTFLMRAAGIPARVVGGYQGGETNAGAYLQVRQYDAHAWSEVWLAGRGWVRVDPTTAVAPQRVEAGLRAALATQGDTAGAALLGGLARLPVLFRLRQWADYIDFSWQKWVLGYRQERQQQLLQHWLGTLTPMRIALALGGALAMCLGALAAFVLLRRSGHRLSPLQREFGRLHGALVRRGMPPAEGVSAAALEQRIGRRWPLARDAARQWRQHFEALAYRNPGAPAPAGLAQLGRLRRTVLRRLG